MKTPPKKSSAAALLKHVALAVAATALSCSFPLRSDADIYRFVTIDGVETFTDAPQNKEAKVIIKASPSSQARKKKGAAGGQQKTHDISLNEIVERAVQANLQTPAPESFEAALPPIGGSITSGPGMRIDPIDGKWRMHNGIDIAVPEGTPVMPVGRGVVVYSGLRPGYGNTVLIEHDNRMLTLYAHNSRLQVAAGQQVDKSTVIALSGNTGRSTGPHLHFEAWHNGTNLTSSFLPGKGGALPPVQLASSRHKAQFRKEVLSDGSILFTNLP